jgi:hypothetical protein
MELQRQLEDQDIFCGGDLSGGGGAAAHNLSGSLAAPLVQNAVIISVYPLDAHMHAVDGDGASDDWTQANVKENLRKVAALGHIINDTVLPNLRKETFDYPWHLGGDGLTFGAECQSVDNSDGTLVPHLRAVLRYGHCIADEWFAVAFMYHLMEVLEAQHKTSVAVEMIDADDGQFLLIEAADALPDWVDELGVDGMRHRAWLSDGSIRLLPPSLGKSSGAMSQIEAIQYLQSSPSDMTMAPSAVQELILAKVQPFLDAIECGTSHATQVRTSVSEYLHRAAMVLPLNVAILIRDRPDLIPAAVRAFCRHEIGQQRSDTKTQRKASTGINGSGDGLNVAFERLVTTVVTLSRTTYAVLLTGEGSCPPPFPVPKEYRSVELNRMRRRLKNDALTDRFRHALEGGIRLTRGLELLLGRASPTSGSGATIGTSSGDIRLGDSEQRICLHWSRLSNELGMSGDWIRQAWSEGPNGISDDKRCIDAFLTCPVYRPEMTRGGLWPLSHPGKMAQEVARALFRAVPKSGLAETDFPMTREDDIDGDWWIDLESPHSAEELMKEIVSSHGERQKKVLTSEQDGQQIQSMLGGLQSFLSTKSDFDGVRWITQATTKNMQCDESILNKEISIDSRTFIGCLLRSLKNASSHDGSAETSRDGLFHADDYRFVGGSDSQGDDDDSMNTDEGQEHGGATIQGAMVNRIRFFFDESVVLM